MRIEIYTDGSCSKNPGPGGWAAIVYSNSNVEKIIGNSLNTTNNRMELKAVIEGLKYCDKIECESIYIYSDSAYVVNAIKKDWISKWKDRSWKTAKGDEVKNKEMWIELNKILKKIKQTKKLRIIKVKGHSDNINNALADKLARQACEILL